MLDPLHNIRLRHRFFDQVEAEDPYEQAKRVCSLLPVLMGGFGSSGSYQISRSMRLRDDGANVNLTRTIVPTVGTKWTFVARVKRGKLGAAQDLLSCGPNANNSMEFGFTSGDALSLYWGNGSAQNQIFATTAIYRDPAAWYDIQLAIDTTQVTATNRAVLYVNGVQVTSFAVSGFTSLGQNFTLSGANTAFAIGNAVFASAAYFGGLIADVHFVDGQTLSPSSFGRVDGTSGVWVPMAYTGTYGTSGFHLDFSDNSAATAAAIGKDSSGNGNNWTPNNASVAAGTANDSFVDTPTNYGTDTGAGGEVRGNYCTLNPLAKSLNAAVSNANYVLASVLAGNWSAVTGTVGLTSGKWYWEWTIGGSAGDNNHMVGVCDRLYQPQTVASSFPGIDGHGVAYYGPSGNKMFNSAQTGYGAAYGSLGDVIGVALDVGGGTVTFYKNGVSQGAITHGLVAPLFPAFGEYDTAGNFGWANFGQRPFAFAAPAGFKAICTQNITTPAVLQPSKFFDINLRTGTGAGFTVSGKAFQPDFVWNKSRSAATSHMLQDSVRGATQSLSSDSTAAEATNAQGVLSFTSDGFTGGTGANWNTNGATYVDFLWKKGVAPGFDIVTGTKGSGAENFNHSLGVTPQMILVKDRLQGTFNWILAHTSLADMVSAFLTFNTTGAASSIANLWNTGPTSSIFGLTNSIIANGSTFIAYLWAEVPGFSRFGSYSGNAAADGTFVWCGFRPRYILIKNAGAAENWFEFDTARDPINAAGNWLSTSVSNAEGGAGALPFDVLSNGFKWRQSSTGNVGNVYVFAAFAEAPFNYARAR